MYIKRIAERSLSRILESGKIGMVLGARQVGKTTLMEHVLSSENNVRLNFDLEFDKQRFLAASALPPRDAMVSLGRPRVLILDEAQRMPEAFRTVKGWYDAGAPVKFILLGSSSLNLLSLSAEPLTGRNRKLYLPPLLFEEVLAAQEWWTPEYSLGAVAKHFAEPLRFLLLQSMAYGLYPEVVTKDEKRELLQDLSSDYLWKDVLQTGLVKTPDTIKKLLLLLAHQVGAEVSVSELAVQLHTARATVDRYLDLLEQTFVIFRLPAFSTNPRKEISKSQKIFFWDTGIRNALLKAFSTEPDRSDIGALWENWAIAEVAKRNILEGRPASLYFWRSRAQSEVDLVVQRDDTLRAFELKWKADGKANRAFREAYGVDVEQHNANHPFIGASIFDDNP